MLKILQESGLSTIYLDETNYLMTLESLGQEWEDGYPVMVPTRQTRAYRANMFAEGEV